MRAVVAYAVYTEAVEPSRCEEGDHPVGREVPLLVQRRDALVEVFAGRHERIDSSGGQAAGRRVGSGVTPPGEQRLVVRRDRVYGEGRPVCEQRVEVEQ